jgi:hypothetical protein
MSVKKIALATVLGALVVFVWNAISWQLLPWHRATISTFKDENNVIEVLKENSDGNGVYLVPNPPGQQGQDRKQEALGRMIRGPVAFVSFQQEGVKFGVLFAKEIIRTLLAALLITLLLTKTTGLTTLGGAVFVATIALVSSILVHLQGWTHFYFSSEYTAVMVIDLTLAWFLAGLVMSRILWGKKAAPDIRSGA